MSANLASCPVLYAMDTAKSTCLSAASCLFCAWLGIAVLLEPGRSPIRVPGSSFVSRAAFAPRDGRYEIKIGEPMEEIGGRII